MNTFLSEAQLSVKEHYRTVAREKIEPLAGALESQSASLKEFLQDLGQAGFLGLTVDKELGGQGCSFLDLALFIEAVSECEPGLAFTIAAHTTAIELITRYGSDKQKSRYLPILARGEIIGGFAIGEDAAGTDFEGLHSLAVRAEGQLLLNGKKVWVVNAELAGLLLVLCRVIDDESSQGSHLALALVDMSANEAVKISPNRSKLGFRSAYTNDVEFDRAVLSEDCLLKGSDDVAEMVQFGMDISKTLIAASATGLLDKALALAVDHARNREQFGQSIGKFQGIQWKLADHNADFEAARLLTYRAAWSKDESPAEFRKNAAMCKWYAAKTARVHSAEALQILGSFGVGEDCALEQFYRDAKMMEICEGTSEFQKLQLVKELDL